MTTNEKPSPKRVIYLWGAGATHAEAQHLGASVSLLMRDNKHFGEGIATRILKVVRRDAGNWDAGTSQPDQSVKLLAVVSLVCWITAIVGGRLIAYL